MSGGVINSGSNPNLHWPGIKKIFGDSYREKPLMWKQIFDMAKSEKHMEVVQGMTGFGLVGEVRDSENIALDSTRQGYQQKFVHKVYAMGYAVTQTEMEDNLYKDVGTRRSTLLARSFRQTGEILHAAFFDNGFDSVNHPVGDGAALFDNARQTAFGLTQRNRPTIDSDLDTASLEDAYTDITLMQDDRGIQCNLKPDCLIVPAQSRFVIKTLLGSPLRPGTDHNDINALKSLGAFSKDPIVWTYLTDPDAWYIKTDAEAGFMHYDRMPLTPLERDSVFLNYNMLHRARERYSFGTGDWRGGYGCPGV